MLQTPRFIARRLGIRGGSSRLMLRVAAFSVAVSMAVMLVALAVVGGFRREVGVQVASLAAHLQITARGGGHSYESLPIRYDSSLVARVCATEGITHLQRYAAKAGILRGDSSLQGILVKGVGADFDTAYLHQKLVQGTIPHYTDSLRSREVLISQTISRTMRLGLGDQFEVLFVGDMEPRRDRFRVSGIYQSGMPEFDKLLVIAHIGVVQRLNDWPAEFISGYEVSVHTTRSGSEMAREVDQVAQRLTAWIDPSATEEQPIGGWGVASEEEDAEVATRLEVSTLQERYPQIFDWLDMLGVNTTLVIVIMLVVAVVNMISGVLIVVLEQTRTIGLLKALGMPTRSLQQIFILRSASITLRGMLWGNLVGLGLCALQHYTGALTLDADSYMIPVVPVSLDWMTVVALNLGTFVTVTAMMTLPTLIIARITPDKAIRFQ